MTKISCLTTFLIIISLAGCQSTSSSTIKDQELIASMEKVDNYDGLIAHYKSQLESGVATDEVMEKLAWAYFDKGDIESSSFYVEHLIQQGVSTPGLYQLKGQVAESNDMLDIAIESYLDSLALGSTSGQLHILLGVAYSKADEYQLSRKHFNQARLLGVDDVTIKNNLAMLYLAQHDYQRVIDILVPVVRDNPNNTKVRANLAIALIKNDQFEAARQLLDSDYSDREMMLIYQQLSVTGS
ncbi:tetratricopeptide repeat protein [Vibrio agarivorans]|uniref:tetratricopeptide repeat protein n=1 Tax=Vibrio agarivorans TaxID=153622 RepID=UPI0022327D16|nr:tetratricopeptide repeat protein [Vibrio agarivorans]